MVGLRVSSRRLAGNQSNDEQYGHKDGSEYQPTRVSRTVFSSHLQHILSSHGFSLTRPLWKI
jgi:hypothetical protein